MEYPAPCTRMHRVQEGNAARPGNGELSPENRAEAANHLKKTGYLQSFHFTLYAYPYDHW
jgi:hypothetical protein